MSQFRTVGGGAHERGLWEGLGDAVRRVARDHGRPATAVRERLERGIVAIVHAGLYAPEFGAPTRDRLLSPEARTAMREVVRHRFERFLRARPALLGSLLE